MNPMSIAYASLAAIFLAFALVEIALGAYAAVYLCEDGSDLGMVVFLLVVWAPDTYEVIAYALQARQLRYHDQSKQPEQGRHSLVRMTLTLVSRLIMAGIVGYGMWSLSGISFGSHECRVGNGIVAVALVLGVLHVCFLVVVVLTFCMSFSTRSAQVGPTQEPQP